MHMVNISRSPLLRDAHRIVVKVGSSLVTNDGRGLDDVAIGEWCRQLAHLIRNGREVIMVSSGAIAEGMKRLGWRTRPHEVHELQAAAAVGQMGLACGPAQLLQGRHHLLPPGQGGYHHDQCGFGQVEVGDQQVD